MSKWSRSREDSTYAWVVVSALAVTVTVSYGVLTYTFGIVLVPMQRELGWSRIELTGAFSLALAVWAVAGVGVGIAIDRSIPMIVAMLGVLKAGAAYLPLDSSYPPERLRFMLDDARPEALITDGLHKGAFESSGVRLICLDRDRLAIGRESEENPPRQNTAEGSAAGTRRRNARQFTQQFFDVL